MKILILAIAAILGIASFVLKSKTYTHESWDEQCRKDFEKHGPLPDNIDVVTDLKKGDVVYLDRVCKVKIIWCNDELMQVEYDDMSRKLLKRKNYLITSL